MSLGERLKAWFDHFWFLRGVAAAWFISTAIPNLVDMDRYEALRVLHAAIVGWNRVAAGIGDLVGRLPLLPHLSANAVNAFFFASTVGGPAAYLFIAQRKARIAKYQKPRPARPSGFWAKIGYEYATIPVAVFRYFAKTSRGSWILVIGFAFAAFFVPGYAYFMISEGIVYGQVQNPSALETFFYWFFIIRISLFEAILLNIAFFEVKGFAKGVFTFVTCLLALEVMYLVGGPEFRDFVSSFADRVIHDR